MESQQLIINSTFERMSLIGHTLVQFSFGERRPITVSLPTIRDGLEGLDFKLFLTLISLTETSLASFGMKVPFKINSPGDIIQGFIAFTEYKKVLIKYFSKYIQNCELKEDGLYTENEKILSYELEYAANIILVAAGVKPFEDKKEEKQENLDPALQKVLEKQRLAEEKLRKAKAKKAEKHTSNLTIEEIMLAVTYEFNFSFKDLLDSNYFALIWYFGFVSKVDAHKLNQLIISSGFSKQKTYNYWLTK